MKKNILILLVLSGCFLKENQKLGQHNKFDNNASQNCDCNYHVKIGSARFDSIENNFKHILIELGNLNFNTTIDFIDCKISNGLTLQIEGIVLIDSYMSDELYEPLPNTILIKCTQLRDCLIIQDTLGISDSIGHFKITTNYSKYDCVVLLPPNKKIDLTWYKLSDFVPSNPIHRKRQK